MTLIAIAVVAANRVIGDGADQPFKIQADLARFRKLTMGHPMIMGRRTWESIGLLPGRQSIVLTSKPNEIDFPLGEDNTPVGYAVSSIPDALEIAHGLDSEKIYVIGGGEIYQAMWPHLDELDLTLVDQDAEGSVLFPEIDSSEWDLVERTPGDGYEFVRYRRNRRPF